MGRGWRLKGERDRGGSRWGRDVGNEENCEGEEEGGSSSCGGEAESRRTAKREPSVAN